MEARTLDRPLPGSDVQAAAQTARNAGAAFAISGTYQINGDQIRVNAQLTDAASAHAVGTLQATGDVRDLFKIEDSLASQLQGILQPTPQSAQTIQTPSTSQLPQVTYGPQQSTTYTYTPSYTYTNDQPQQTYAVTPTQPTYETPTYETPTYYYPNYTYTYSSPTYCYPHSYSYPYFFGGIIISNGHFRGGFHDGFHGGFRDGFHGGFHGGMNGGGMMHGGHR